VGNSLGGGSSLQREHSDSKELDSDTIEPLELFERLESVIAGLADSRRQLQAENTALRGQLLERARHLEGLDERLLDANQRRQDALKRVDDLIARLEQMEMDVQFGPESAARAGGASGRRN